MGNFYSDVMDAALEAASKGVIIVRASRVPHGGVYTELGEVDDTECGFVAARSLNPQKARIMLMLALTRTSDVSQIRQYFDSDRRTVHPAR